MVLSILRSEKFYVAPHKYTFLVSSILFLGYRISADGIWVDNAKIDSILSWSTPTTMTAVWSFHGLPSFYRHFIPNFNSIMVPIIDFMHEITFS